MDTQIFSTLSKLRKDPFILQKKREAQIPRLKSVLRDLAPLPSDNVLIGVCDDGIPVLMDMAKPSAGSILIIAGPCSGKTDLLLSILSSACQTNPHRRLRVSCITSRPEQIESISQYPHLYKSSLRGSESSGDLIEEFYYLVRQRQETDVETPAILLGIDDIGELLQQLTPEQVDQLCYLVQNGASVKVRTIATVESTQLQDLGDLLELFGAHLVGKMENDGIGMNLAQIPEEAERELKRGAQFCAKFAGEWVPFWILS